jgi:hypothetical protein
VGIGAGNYFCGCTFTRLVWKSRDECLETESCLAGHSFIEWLVKNVTTTCLNGKKDRKRNCPTEVVKPSFTFHGRCELLGAFYNER